MSDFVKLLTSSEYDSFLSKSTIDSFVVDFVKESSTDTVEIGFRASDVQSDPLSDLQWTPYLVINTMESIQYEDTPLPKIQGRFKQIRFRLTY